MTWQAPSGPAYPGQPGGAYPGQPGAQLPGQPGFPYGPQPGSPFAGQPVNGFQPPFPPEVIQAAQAADLGMPTREYSKASKGAKRLNPGLGAARAVLAIGRYSLIGSVVFVLIIGVVLLLVVPFPYNVFSAGLTVAITLLADPAVSRGVWSFDEGVQPVWWQPWSLALLGLPRWIGLYAGQADQYPALGESGPGLAQARDGEWGADDDWLCCAADEYSAV